MVERGPQELPTDAIEVLSDDKWHPVLARPGMNARDNSPLTFWIGKKGQDDAFDGMSYSPEEEPYRLEFHRNPESWAREGMDLGCEGRAKVDQKTLPVYFLSIEGIGEFLTKNEGKVIIIED